MAKRVTVALKTARSARPRSRSEEVVLFVLLSCLLSWAAWLVLRQAGIPLAPRMLVAMFGPMLAARLLIPPGQSVLLVPPRRRKLAATAREALVGVAVAAALVGLGVLLSVFGGDIWFRPDLGSHLATLAGPAPALVVFYLLMLPAAFAEEYGWRGFMHSRLSALGPLGAAMLTGPAWALWHSPAVLMDGFDFPVHHVLGIGMLVVMFLPLSIVQSWLRERTGGLAAPTAAHYVFNLAAALLALFTTRTTGIIAAPVGLLGFVPFALFAAWLVWTRRIKLVHHRERLVIPVPQLVSQPQPVAVWS